MTWCHFFMPIFENLFILSSSAMFLFMSFLFLHPLPLYMMGIFVIVFWTLTCLQCPITCHQYRGEFSFPMHIVLVLWTQFVHLFLFLLSEMCDFNFTCVGVGDIMWCWPIIASLSLVNSYFISEETKLTIFNKKKSSWKIYDFFLLMENSIIFFLLNLYLELFIFKILSSLLHLRKKNNVTGCFNRDDENICPTVL